LHAVWCAQRQVAQQPSARTSEASIFSIFAFICGIAFSNSGRNVRSRLPNIAPTATLAPELRVLLSAHT
jgi:hypothetical protein